MRADALTLAAALNNSEVDFYTIPQYQRPYTWLHEEYETLWDDLTEAFNDYRLKTDAKETPEYYFMGPVVFVINREQSSLDIIDGQQRTTTFHILLWYLYRRISDDVEKQRIHSILTFQGRQPKLKVSSKDAATYLEIRSGDSDSAVSGNSRMAAAGNFFKSKIATLDNPDQFAAFLRSYIQFIVIVAEDYSKAWDLFIGINGKGVPLNPTDLVKAYVCGKSDIGGDAGAVWEERMLPLGGNSTAFLLFLSRYKARKFVTENHLFKEIARLFPSQLSLLDISENAKLFNLFWLKAIDEIPNEFVGGFNFTHHARRSLRILREIGRRDFTTLLFKYADAFGLKSLFEEPFLKALASYQLRMSMTRKRSRERNFVNEFKDVQFISAAAAGDTRTAAEKLREDKQAALELIKTYLRSDAPDDKLFETLVGVSLYGSNATRIIMQHFEEGMRGNRSVSEFHLEHLMPNTGTQFWYPFARVVDANGKADLVTYNALVNNIGNLFVIDSVTNNEIKNYEYTVKKSHYQQHLSGWSIATVTATKAEWNKEDIEARAKQIGSWAKNHWRI